MILIELNKVSKVYEIKRQRKYVLRDLSLRFYHKGLYVIYGPSGSGKSTLLKLLAGLIDPTRGQYFYRGQLWKKGSIKAEQFRRHEVGFIFQDYHLFSRMSVVENIAFPLIVRGLPSVVGEKRALGLLGQFHLEDLAERSVDHCSGGEKQRVACLRAFIGDPTFLLCDEPTGSLDASNGRLVMDMLKSFSQTKLVIMVTHQLSMAKKYADKIFCLKDGILHEEK